MDKFPSIGDMLNDVAYQQAMDAITSAEEAGMTKDAIINSLIHFLL